MATILITGGTGLVGKALGQALLKKGYQIIILSRNADKSSTIAGLSYALWNVEAQTIDRQAIEKADYIIHLAGAGVADKRWTKKRKEEIVESRVKSSQLIVDSLKTIPNKVQAVVSASAIGWYGADDLTPGKSTKFIESDPAANDFLGTTCKLWEESIEPVTQQGIRLVKLRIGIVLSKDGGALKEFIKPLKFGIASILGNGKQMISWIHIADLVNMFVFAIEKENMKGSYNAVAPQPVSNKELTLQLARSRNKFFIPVHVPAFLLKMIIGEMSIEVLKSTTVSNDKISNDGFKFQFPDISVAVNNLLVKNKQL